VISALFRKAALALKAWTNFPNFSAKFVQALSTKFQYLGAVMLQLNVGKPFGIKERQSTI
jgi:hypothetical protein